MPQKEWWEEDWAIPVLGLFGVGMYFYYRDAQEIGKARQAQASVQAQIPQAQAADSMAPGFVPGAPVYVPPMSIAAPLAPAPQPKKEKCPPLTCPPGKKLVEIPTFIDPPPCPTCVDVEDKRFGPVKLPVEEVVEPIPPPPIAPPLPPYQPPVLRMADYEDFIMQNGVKQCPRGYEPSFTDHCGIADIWAQEGGIWKVISQKGSVCRKGFLHKYECKRIGLAPRKRSRG